MPDGTGKLNVRVFDGIGKLMVWGTFDQKGERGKETYIVS